MEPLEPARRVPAPADGAGGAEPDQRDRLPGQRLREGALLSAHGGKGGEGPGDRRLARRPDDQDPRDLRPSREARRAQADARNTSDVKAAGELAEVATPLQGPGGRSRVRQPLPRHAQGSGHSVSDQSQAADPTRPAPISGPLADRGGILSAERLQTRSDTLRQARDQDPVRRRVLAMNVSGP